MRELLESSAKLAKIMTQNFTLSGKAKPVGPRWKEGFKDAYEATLRSKNPSISPSDGPFGKDWCIQDGEYSHGYAEGWISGRSTVLNNLYN